MFFKLVCSWSALTAALALHCVATSQVLDVVVDNDVAIPIAQVRDIIARGGRDSVEVRIARAYAALGYLDATVAESIAGSLRIVVGRRYRVSRVRFIVADSTAPLLEPSIRDGKELEGGYFSTVDVESLTLSTVRLLTARGFALADVSPHLTIDSDSAAVSLDLRVEDRGAIRIARIDVEGNTTTRRSLILKAADLSEDRLYTDGIALGIRRRVERLGLFSRVDEPILFLLDSADDLYGLLIRVAEGSPNVFDGVIGFQPAATSAGDPVIIGQVSISLGNIFGSGRRLALRWSRQSNAGSRLDLRYGEPYFLDLPIAIEAGYGQTLQDESAGLVSYVQRGVDIGGAYGVSDAFSIRLNAALEWTIPEIDSTQSCERQILQTRMVEGTVGIAYDTRSDRYNPWSGVFYRTGYAVGDRGVQGPFPCDTSLPNRDTRQRVELDLETYIPFGKQIGEMAFDPTGVIVVATSIHYRQVSALLLDQGDLYRVGGSGSVRGYRDAEFQGARVAWGALEGRALIAPRSHVALFVDAGYFSRPPDPIRPSIPSAERWLVGYGISGQIETAIGLVRLSYALGKDDSFDTGKISFGLVNLF